MNANKKEYEPGVAHELASDWVQLCNDADNIQVDSPREQKVPELHNLVQRWRASTDR